MTPSERRPPRFDGHQYPQIIPDPGEIEVGGPAPWSGTSRRKDLSLDIVRAQLRDAHRLLGTRYSARISPKSSDSSPTERQRRSRIVPPSWSPCLKSRGRVTLSSRGAHLRCALIAGRSPFREGAATRARPPTETALREAQEEVGLDPAAVTPYAWLSPIATFASGSAIFPIVGLAGPSARTASLSRPKLIARSASRCRTWSPMAPSSKNGGGDP